MWGDGATSACCAMLRFGAGSMRALLTPACLPAYLAPPSLDPGPAGLRAVLWAPLHPLPQPHQDGAGGVAAQQHGSRTGVAADQHGAVRADGDGGGGSCRGGGATAAAPAPYPAPCRPCKLCCGRVPGSSRRRPLSTEQRSCMLHACVYVCVHAHRGSKLLHGACVRSAGAPPACRLWCPCMNERNP